MRDYRISPDGLQLRFKLSGKSVGEVAKTTGIRPDIIEYMLTGEVEPSEVQTRLLVDALGVRVGDILQVRLGDLLDLLTEHGVESAHVRGAIAEGVDAPMDEVELVIAGGATGLAHFGLINDIETVLATPVTAISPEMVDDGERFLELVRRREQLTGSRHLHADVGPPR